MNSAECVCVFVKIIIYKKSCISKGVVGSWVEKELKWEDWEEVTI